MGVGFGVRGSGFRLALELDFSFWFGFGGGGEGSRQTERTNPKAKSIKKRNFLQNSGKNLGKCFLLFAVVSLSLSLSLSLSVVVLSCLSASASLCLSLFSQKIFQACLVFFDACSSCCVALKGGTVSCFRKGTVSCCVALCVSLYPPPSP